MKTLRKNVIPECFYRGSSCFWIPAFAGMTLGLLLWVSSASAGSFEAAGDKYRAGDFKSAAHGYQEMIQLGEGTTAVYYNLGNALLRSGKKAQALLAYQRALRADPRNTDLRWNIGVVQALLADRPEEGATSWLEVTARTLSWVSIDETAAVLIGLVLLLALLGWVQFGRRADRLDRFQIILFVVALLVAALFFFQLRQEGRSRVIVTEPEVTLRYGPAFSETKAFVLHDGATAEVLDESGDWWYISFGKNAGWLPKKAGEIV